jgi:hypothetical protein
MTLRFGHAYTVPLTLPRRRDPRLRQPPDQQQFTQMPRISPVGLRALLLALQRARLGRLGQVHLRADTVELLDHEPPARRRLQRDLQTLALERHQKRPNPGAIRRCDARTEDLAGHRVDPLRRDLRTMLIHAHHERHALTPFTSPPSRSLTTRALTRAASSPTHRIPVSHGRYLLFEWPAARPAIRACLCRRSTRRAGHLHSRRVNANRDITSFGRDEVVVGSRCWSEPIFEGVGVRPAGR